MTARFFADTNIAVYSLDEDSDKRQRCFEILRRRPVISVQVTNEFLSVLLSKRRIDGLPPIDWARYSCAVAKSYR